MFGRQAKPLWDVSLRLTTLGAAVFWACLIATPASAAGPAFVAPSFARSLAGTVTVSATGTGPMELKIDGQHRAWGDGGVTYTWRTRAEQNAVHQLSVTDSSGNQAASATTSNPAMVVTPLSSGKEAMYAEFNQGDIDTAQNMLENIWPARWPAPLPYLSSTPAWTEDPFNDPYWRFYHYGLRPLSNLLYAWRTTGNRAYADRLTSLIRSNVAVDATRGANTLTFDNPHTAAYRAMALVNLLVKLDSDGLVDDGLRAGVMQSLGKLGAFLALPANFESTHNHGFTEAAALLLIADNEPTIAGAAGWRTLAIERLKQLVVDQIGPDGVQVENSPFYHVFVLGLMIQIGNWAATWEPELGRFYADNLKRMYRYAAYITQPDGYLPLLGATATTYMPSQDPNIFGPSLVTDSDFRWAVSSGSSGTAPPPGVYLFPNAGQFVLRSKTPAPASRRDQTFVTFDAGPYRTDHSDLDALGVNIYSDGRRLVSEAGLFTYTAGTDRSYFHGTRGHNTVMVDGADQAVGNGLPGAYGNIGDSSWATGVSKLYDGVTHRRTVVVLAKGLELVGDRLYSPGQHSYSQLWHFPSDLALATQGADLALSDRSNRRVLSVRQAHPSQLGMATFRGGLNPMRGWQSTTFSIKDPAWEVEYGTLAMTRTRTFMTLFQSGEYASLPGSVTEVAQGLDSVVTVCVGASTAYSVLIPDGNKAVTVQALDSCPSGAAQPTDSYTGPALPAPPLPPAPQPKIRAEVAAPSPLQLSASDQALAHSLPATGRVPVLLFHSICDATVPCTDYNMTRSEFARTLLMIRAAGFQSIGIEDFDRFLRGNPVTLPAKPILLTFDDGRTDAMVNASDILRKTGQKAVMFAVSGWADGGDQRFSTWPELAAMQASGLWDIQLHANNGHVNIACGRNPDGSVILLPFYACLADQSGGTGAPNYETTDQWASRVKADLNTGEAKLAQNIPGHKAIAFAVPYGDYGQSVASRRLPSGAEVMAKMKAELDSRYGLDWFVQAPDPDFTAPQIRPFRFSVRSTTKATDIYAWLAKHSR